MEMAAIFTDDGFLVPESPDTRKKAQTALQTAQRLTISDNETFSQAGTFRDGLKAIEKEINDTFDGPISAAFKAHKAIVAAKKTYSEPLEYALRLIKQKMIAWDEEQRRKQRLEQARLEAEAKKKADDEAMELAAELEKAGLNREAEEVIAEPVQVAPVVAPKLTPKIEGFSYRANWKWRVTNAALIPREYLTTDDLKISGIVRAMKKATNIPGIEVYEEKV
jgi:hypothetical protein